MHQPAYASADNRRRIAPSPVWLFIGSCLASISATVVGSSVFLLQERFPDAPPTLVQFVAGAPILAMVVFAPIVGVLVDRYGRALWIPVGLVLYTVAGVAPMVLNSIGAIVVSRVFVGLATAMVVTTCTVLLGDTFAGLRRARKLALMPIFVTISGVLGLSVGAQLGTISWRAPYAVFIIGVLLLPFMTAPRAGRPVVAQTKPASRIPVGPRPASLTPFLLLTIVASTIVSLPLVQTYALVELTGFVSGGMIIAVGSLNGLAMVAGCVAGREVLESPPGRALAIGFSVAALGFGIISASPGVPGVVLGVAVIAGLMLASFGSGVLLPVLLVRTVGAVDYGQRGRGVGLWQAAYFLGQFVTPVAFASLSTLAGGAFSGLFAVAVLCLAAAVGVGVAARRRARWRRPMTPPPLPGVAPGPLRSHQTQDDRDTQ